MKTKTTRKGSGRTKGSFSFVSIPMTDLTAKLNPTSVVVVSRKYAESIGFTGLKVTNAADTLESIQGTNPQTAATVTVTQNP